MDKEINRVGNFSSSSIYRLTGIGSRNMTALELESHKLKNPKSRAKTIKAKDTTDSKFDTYVKEKYFERKLGRSLNSETQARSTAWGHLVEEQAFSKLGLEFSLVSRKRYAYPDSDLEDYWNGMPDLITPELVGDIKSPWTMNSFCNLVEALDSVEKFKEDYPDYYWQLVSNAILTKRNKALIIVYCPYKSNLDEIRKLASDDLDPKFAFINWADDNELPYLIEGNYYNDINMLEFDIPKEDKDFLIERVTRAKNKLIELLRNKKNKIIN